MPPKPAAIADAPQGQLHIVDPTQWLCDASWQPLIDHFFAEPVGSALLHRLQVAMGQGLGPANDGNPIYPPQPLRALSLTPLPAVRVVVLGQDPYHGPGQANGLAFSVASGARIPPSLRNIFKELTRCGMPPRHDGCLDDWARQGVLLLNTALTVSRGQPGSHAKWGWAVLTDRLIQAIASQAGAVVFLLWGAHAQSKAAFIAANSPPHAQRLTLSSNHPSPLSANRVPTPFIGNHHFVMANQALTSWGQAPIAW